MIPDYPVFSVQPIGRPDVKNISKFSALRVDYIGLIDSKSQALLFPELYQNIFSYDMLPGTFKILQVIGMLYDTGVISILIIDLHWKMMYLTAHVG